MFIKTKAFVLHRNPYNDNYSIVHLYTFERGRVGVLLPNSRKRRKRGAIVLTPLCEVEVLLEFKPHRDLAYIKEMKVLNPNHSIQLQANKCSQAIFISELLYRSLTISEADLELYEFLSYSFALLASLEQGVANFYLCFTYKLLEYFAVSPLVELSSNLKEGQEWFDMENGCFTKSPVVSDYVLDLEESQHLKLFVRMNYQNLAFFRYNRGHRARILDRLMQYYQLHIPNFKALQSIAILRNSSAT